MFDELPWSKGWPWTKRCKARKTNDGTCFYGRCELIPHWGSTEHALERGMVWVRWQDGPVRFESPHYKPEEN